MEIYNVSKWIEDNKTPYGLIKNDNVLEIKNFSDISNDDLIFLISSLDLRFFEKEKEDKLVHFLDDFIGQKRGNDLFYILDSLPNKKTKVIFSSLFEDNPKNPSVLQFALYHNKPLKIIEFLVENGADVTKGDDNPVPSEEVIFGDYKRTKNPEAANYINPVMVIALRYKAPLETIKYLVQEGASVTTNENEPGSLSTLGIALRYKAPLETIKVLVENGADVTKNDNSSEKLSVLETAIMSLAPLETIKYLVQEGAKVTTGEESDKLYSPIEIASEARFYSKSIVDYLIRQGANKSLTGKKKNERRDYYPVAHIGEVFEARMSFVEFKERIEEGKLRNFISKSLMIALQQGTTATIIQLLVEHGADVTKNDNNPEKLSVLQEALRNSASLEIVEFLVNQGADVTKNDNNLEKISVLEAAIRYQASLETIKILVENGADVTKDDNGSLSVLKQAYDFNISKEVIDYIKSERDKKLGKKSNPQSSIESLERETPPKKTNLSETASLIESLEDKFSLRKIKYLVEEKGADVTKNDNNPEKHSVLEKALKNNASLEIVEFLVNQGADVTKNDNNPEKHSVLEKALKNSASLEIVEFLVNRGADVAKNDNNPEKHSVLEKALKNSASLEIVEFLVNQGADVAKNDNNPEKLSVLEKALKNNASFEIVEFLVNQGADVTKNEDNPNRPSTIEKAFEYDACEEVVDYIKSKRDKKLSIKEPEPEPEIETELGKNITNIAARISNWFNNSSSKDVNAKNKKDK